MPRQPLNERIDNDFRSHELNAEQYKCCERVREETRDLAHLLAENCPEGRELSLALTNLELVMFWTNAAIARKAADG